MWQLLICLIFTIVKTSEDGCRCSNSTITLPNTLGYTYQISNPITSDNCSNFNIFGCLWLVNSKCDEHCVVDIAMNSSFFNLPPDFTRTYLFVYVVEDNGTYQDILFASTGYSFKSTKTAQKKLNVLFASVIGLTNMPWAISFTIGEAPRKKVSQNYRVQTDPF